jgi:nitrogen-specific signal transduction histidine kinase
MITKNGLKYIYLVSISEVDANTDIYIQVLLNINRNKMNTDIPEAPVSYNVICFTFFCDERRIILDNSWVHQHVTITLDYTTNIHKLIFI